MTDVQRKRLTGYLGECWDADKRLGGDLPNRTFDTDVDMMALFRKMVDNEKISRSAAIGWSALVINFFIAWADRGINE